MAGHRRRDIDSAPGSASGAESFAREGIVSLADLVRDLNAAQPVGKKRARGGSGVDAVGARGRVDRSVAKPAGDVGRTVESKPDRRGSHGEQSDQGHGTRSNAGHLATRGRNRDTSSTRTGDQLSASRDPLALSHTGSDSPGSASAFSTRDAEPRHEPPAEGPVYESLFGNDGDTRKRPRRERKPATALQRALGLLTRREHSRKELTRKLVSRGVDAAEVEAAVGKLAEAGWQDERRFAENLVRARASAGYGPLHIRAELATHDLPPELRQQALDGFEGDWAEIAADCVRRRFGRVDDDRLRARKAADFLMRRGFPGDVARTASRFDPDGD